MKKISTAKMAAAVAMSLATLSMTQVQAAGFQLTEQSSLGAGRAYAGAGIVGDDLSAVHYNPAGMTLLPGTQIQAGAVYIGVDAPYTDRKTGAHENGMYNGQPIPAGFITHQLNDQVWLGLAMTVPFGMGTEYDKDWSAKDRGTNSMILTVDINPNVAWKVNEFLSVGGGISLQYAHAKLGTHLSKGPLNVGQGEIDADSWDWGYNFGVMLSPTEKLRFGLAYRSAIEHNAEGDFTLKNGALNAAMGVSKFTFDSKATVKTPSTLMLTGTWEANDALRLSGLIRWAKWSNFDTLTIKNKTPAGMEALGQHSIENDWEDTWLFSVGADYRINDAWTVRGGVAYEKDPISDNSLRMAVIPDTDRLWLSLGATYHWSKAVQFDFGATYLKGIGNKDLYKTGTNVKQGEYDKIDAYLLGVQAQYRF